MGLDKRAATERQQSMAAWIIPGGIVLLSLLIAFLGDAGREWLRYDRVWIAHGELWRMLTGHIAHLNPSHLGLNSVGLVLVWYLVGMAYSARGWLLIIACTLGSMDLAFWFLNPSLHWYVGMSGLLHGLLAAGIVARWRPYNAETIVLLTLLCLKIGWEQFAGPVPGAESTSGGAVVVDAHLYGAIGGVLGALVARNRVRRSLPI